MSVISRQSQLQQTFSLFPYFTPKIRTSLRVQKMAFGVCRNASVGVESCVYCTQKVGDLWLVSAHPFLIAYPFSPAALSRDLASTRPATPHSSPLISQGARHVPSFFTPPPPHPPHALSLLPIPPSSPLHSRPACLCSPPRRSPRLAPHIPPPTTLVPPFPIVSLPPSGRPPQSCPLV